MLRLVSYRSDRTASIWRAGVASRHTLMDLASYSAVTSRSQTDGTYQSVRDFLAARRYRRG